MRPATAAQFAGQGVEQWGQEQWGRMDDPDQSMTALAERWAAVGPRRGLLDLRGEAQQQILATVRCDELDADRQAVAREVRRQRNRRVARDAGEYFTST